MSATSTEIGPPSAPLRSPSANATTTINPMIAGAAGEEILGVDRVTDRTVDRIGDPHHHGEADEGEQVDAIDDVVPVEFAEPAALPRPSQFLQCCLRVGRRRRGEHI